MLYPPSQMPPTNSTTSKEDTIEDFTLSHSTAHSTEESFSLTRLTENVPRFHFQSHSLTRLDQLKVTLDSHSKQKLFGKPKVNILVHIIDLGMLKNIKTKQGNYVELLQFLVLDQTGTPLQIAVWEAQAKELSENLRLGDIIFISGEFSFSSVITSTDRLSRNRPFLL